MRKNETENNNLIRCEECGSYYDPTELKCPNCGASIDEVEEEIYDDSYDVTDYGGGFGDKESGLTKAALIIVILLLVGALVAVGSLGVKAMRLMKVASSISDMSDISEIPEIPELQAEEETPEEETEDPEAQAQAEAEAQAKAEEEQRQKEEEEKRKQEEALAANNGVITMMLNFTEITLNANESTLLVAKIAPSDWTGELTWSTSNKYVATVDGTGRVTYAGGGDCVVSVASGKLTLECTVHCNGDKVSKEPSAQSVKGTYPVDASGSTGKTDETKKEEEKPKEEKPKDDGKTKDITLNYYDITMGQVGDGTQLTASGGNGTYTWKSADSSIATVNSKGFVIGVAKGKTSVTVTSGDKSATCIVYVK